MAGPEVRDLKPWRLSFPGLEEASAMNATAKKKVDPARNLRVLEGDPSLVKPLDEKAAQPAPGF